tara:strand:- start:7285 stop:7755 length:471 start_codon:yes stop_codon:yes gene_type:complete
MKSAPAFLSKFIQELKPAARQAALGTGLTAGFGLLAGGPTAALAYGAGDFLLNVPAIALARRFSPGTARRLMQVDKKNKPIIDPKTKKPIVRDTQDPTMLQNIANIGASVATYPVVDLVTQGRLYKDRLPTPQEQYFYPGIGPLPESVREQLRAQA